MKKGIILLIIVAFVVTLFSVSCSKKSDVKEFSLQTKIKLYSNSAKFYGTLVNPDNLTEFYLMLKKDSDSNFERHNISYSNNAFALTIGDLDTAEPYKYYYVYVVDGSTKNTNKTTFTVDYSSMIVGRWQDDNENPYYEEYGADGEGKWWGGEDDIQEDEALPFSWYFDENNHMTQIHHFQGGQADIVQYCNIILLDDTRLNYNNDGWRKEYNLFRIN